MCVCVCVWLCVCLCAGVVSTGLFSDLSLWAKTAGVFEAFEAAALADAAPHGSAAGAGTASTASIPPAHAGPGLGVSADGYHIVRCVQEVHRLSCPALPLLLPPLSHGSPAVVHPLASPAWLLMMWR